MKIRPAYAAGVSPQHGKLIVVGQQFRIRNRYHVVCRCACGVSLVVQVDNLRAGRYLSCGCVKASRLATSNHVHGEAGTRLHRIWKGIHRRCTSRDDADYARYGGRGIRVCRAWREYARFSQWAKANGYSDVLTIERIDNNGNYEPENCKWASRLEQNNNRRDNHRVTYSGQTKTISEWAREFGLKPHTLRTRLVVLGWTVEKALNARPGTGRRHKA